MQKKGLSLEGAIFVSFLFHRMDHYLPFKQSESTGRVFWGFWVSFVRYARHTVWSTINIFRCCLVCRNCLSPSSGQKGEMSHPSLVCDSQTSSYIQQVCGVLASMLLASGICQTGPNSQGNMILKCWPHNCRRTRYWKHEMDWWTTS